ncbi:phenylacetate--CoA ligase family protein [Priestia megaterium]|uniref:phenylacetate--CoA ligase family protein n=1 Tax=Priestia megaterium TaxID=1404 RepID=UPI00112BC430|nr:AMP-binding protein [Priestia megaterium]TPF18413.1 phenylacetate--CoA ligase [Priestia megaterium]TPF22523.1 phenylacetate--CoA ligase [Priestia megaterium]
MIIHEVETYPQEQIQDLQLKRLKKTVEQVYKQVPFYKEAFLSLDITPDSISTLQDVKKLPFTQKTDLRNHYPFDLFAIDMKDVARVHASSGTSGKPTVVGYSQQDIENWSQIVARAIALGGGTSGGIFHNAYGYGLFTGGLGMHYGSEKLGMTTVPVSGGNTERQIMLIEDFKPTIIGGTPSYVLKIAEDMESLGKDPRKTSLKYGIFGAEPWSEEMRNVLEEKFAIKACDIYGLSEVMGPGIAMECHEAQNGLHIAEDHFFVEVIDPRTLQPVPDGQEGELVFTSLTKEAFPIIRYRTGDIGSLSRETCECGRTTARMSRVKGRIDDMLIIRGVNLFPSEIEHYLIKIKELAPHYQVYLKRQGSLDYIELHVEVNEHFYHAINGDMKHTKVAILVKTIQQAMKSHCLVSMNVSIFPPKYLPRSSGKAVRVVDKRNVTVFHNSPH